MAQRTWPRDAAKERIWREVVGGYAKSGLSVKDHYRGRGWLAAKQSPCNRRGYLSGSRRNLPGSRAGRFRRRIGTVSFM
jgi:hypothetical protein